MSPKFTWDLDLDDDRSPCPEGCGGLTEDPYGGPCRRCEAQWTTLAAPGVDPP